MSYTKKEVATMFLDCENLERDPNLSFIHCELMTPHQELGQLKYKIRKVLDLTDEEIKEIFDERNYPIYWDIGDGKIKHCDARVEGCDVHLYYHHTRDEYNEHKLKLAQKWK